MNAILKIRNESMILMLIPEVAMICPRGIVMLDMGTGELKMKYTLMQKMSSELRMLKRQNFQF